MTGVAVEEVEFRKNAAAAAGCAVQCQCAIERRRLPDGPGFGASGNRLSSRIVCVQAVMTLQIAEKVEFEGDSGMPGGHHFVGDELVFRGAAEMTIEAHSRALSRLLQSHHSARNIVRMPGAENVMTGKPGLGSAVAGFAAYTI